MMEMIGDMDDVDLLDVYYFILFFYFFIIFFGLSFTFSAIRDWANG